MSLIHSFRRYGHLNPQLFLTLWTTKIWPCKDFSESFFFFLNLKTSHNPKTVWFVMRNFCLNVQSLLLATVSNLQFCSPYRSSNSIHNKNRKLWWLQQLWNWFLFQLKFELQLNNVLNKLLLNEWKKKKNNNKVREKNFTQLLPSFVSSNNLKFTSWNQI